MIEASIERTGRLLALDSGFTTGGLAGEIVARAATDGRGRPRRGAGMSDEAIGAETYKLPFGHRGTNQPVLEVKTGRVSITSQNHGYAVDHRSVPEGWEVWFTPEARVLHHVGGSTRQVRPEMVAESHRSMLRYYEKHYRARLDKGKAK